MPPPDDTPPNANDAAPRPAIEPQAAAPDQAVTAGDVARASARTITRTLSQVHGRAHAGVARTINRVTRGRRPSHRSAVLAGLVTLGVFTGGAAIVAHNRSLPETSPRLGDSTAENPQPELRTLSCESLARYYRDVSLPFVGPQGLSAATPSTGPDFADPMTENPDAGAADSDDPVNPGASSMRSGVTASASKSDPANGGSAHTVPELDSPGVAAAPAAVRGQLVFSVARDVVPRLPSHPPAGAAVTPSASTTPTPSPSPSRPTLIPRIAVGGIWVASTASGQMTQVAQVPLNFAPTALLADHTRLIAYGPLHATPAIELSDRETLSPRPSATPRPTLMTAAPLVRPMTRIAEIDVTNPRRPAVIRTMDVDGTITAARNYAGTLRMTIRSAPHGLTFVNHAPGAQHPVGPSRPSHTSATGTGSPDGATAANRAIIEGSPWSTWVPSYIMTQADGTRTESSLVSCDSVYIAQPDQGYFTTSVLSFQVRRDGINYPRTFSVVGGGAGVYTSASGVYVTTDAPRGPSARIPLPRSATLTVGSTTARTHVHRFDNINGDVGLQYTGSGQVAGSLTATSTISRWGDDVRITTVVPVDTTSALTEQPLVLSVLRQHPGQLVPAGQLRFAVNPANTTVWMSGARGFLVPVRGPDSDSPTAVIFTPGQAPTTAGTVPVRGSMIAWVTCPEGFLALTATDDTIRGSVVNPAATSAVASVTLPSRLTPAASLSMAAPDSAGIGRDSTGTNLLAFPVKNDTSTTLGVVRWTAHQVRFAGELPVQNVLWIHVDAHQMRVVTPTGIRSFASGSLRPVGSLTWRP